MVVTPSPTYDFGKSKDTKKDSEYVNGTSIDKIVVNKIVEYKYHKGFIISFKSSLSLRDSEV